MSTLPESSAAPNGSPPSSAFTRPWAFWAGIATICIMVMGISLGYRLLLKKRYSPERELPVIAKIHGDLETTERLGQTVRMAELDGRVRVFAYIYTVCPHGCAAVVGEMLKLHKKFGHRDDFHQVSLSVIPERDTAATMAAYAEGIGLKKDAPWWFLTGSQEKLWAFMSDQLQMAPAVPIPPDERLNPLDIYAHDLRIALVDRAGNVRGYYAVFHPETEIANLMCERLQEDVQRLLDDPDL